MKFQQFRKIMLSTYIYIPQRTVYFSEILENVCLFLGAPWKVTSVFMISLVLFTLLLHEYYNVNCPFIFRTYDILATGSTPVFRLLRFHYGDKLFIKNKIEVYWDCKSIRNDKPISTITTNHLQSGVQ